MERRILHHPIAAIASGAWELSVVDQHSIFVNGNNGSTWGAGMLSFYNLVGIVP
jgi:hypothetical protein